MVWGCECAGDDSPSCSQEKSTQHCNITFVAIFNILKLYLGTQPRLGLISSEPKNGASSKIYSMLPIMEQCSILYKIKQKSEAKNGASSLSHFTTICVGGNLRSDRLEFKIR